MGKIVTFGEILLRLSPPGCRKIQQSSQFDFFFGGTEMNVAASLSKFGLPVQHIGNVSNDIVGEAALATLRQYGIDVSRINAVDQPLGLYFMEVGSDIRSSQVAYNRLNGSFANISPAQVDWDEILDDCAWLHWTGISPAISEGAYQTLKAGLQKAKAKGISVTTDPSYRSNLWKYGRSGQEVLGELVGYSTIFIGGTDEINEIMGTKYAHEKDGFIKAAIELQQRYPSIEKVFDKVRTSVSASWQKVYGRAWADGKYLETAEIEITAVVDRIGTGDAFAAGLIYGLQQYDDQFALDFANAACAIKHTIVGDVNLASVSEIKEIAEGKVSGRIKR
jgi:2-dehydro-3-deoxygluconokinase